MEVHGMRANTGVQPSPADRFPHLEREAFGVGPGLAVDRRNCRRRTWVERNFFVPETDDEDTVYCGDTWRVDDKGSGQLRFYGRTQLQCAAGCGDPVVVRARFACLEAHFLRAARLQDQGVPLVARSFVQTMHRRRNGKCVVHGGVDLRALRHPNLRTWILE